MQVSPARHSGCIQSVFASGRRLLQQRSEQVVFPFSLIIFSRSLSENPSFLKSTPLSMSDATPCKTRNTKRGSSALEGHIVENGLLALPQLGCQTDLNLTSWVWGTHPSPLERRKSRFRRNGETKYAATELAMSSHQFPSPSSSVVSSSSHINDELPHVVGPGTVSPASFIPTVAPPPRNASPSPPLLCPGLPTDATPTFPPPPLSSSPRLHPPSTPQLPRAPQMHTDAPPRPAAPPTPHR